MNEQKIISESGVHSANLLEKQNVESYFPGTKKVNGDDTGEECIIVGVREKISKESLSDEDLVPSELNGVKTDVVVVVPMVAEGYCGAASGTTKPSESNTKGCYGHTYELDNTPFEKPQGGISIGPSSSLSAGTLGCVVKDSNGHLVGLTNNHVVGTQIDYSDSSKETTYSVFVESGAFKIIDSSGTAYLKPAFDDSSLPRLVSGNKYIFNADTSLGYSSHKFFITTASTGGSSSQSSAYTSVTIKNSSGTIIYENGSEVGGSGRTDPYIGSNETLEFTYSSNTFSSQLYYQCWNHTSMGNRLDISFLGVPYCFSSNKNSPAPTSEYNDGIPADANKNIIGNGVVTPSNIDVNGNGGSGQINLGTVQASNSIKFQHPQNLSSTGNHGSQPTNKTDCAIIQFGSSTRNPNSDIAGLSASALSTTTVSVGDKVYKSGRTTGVTPQNAKDSTNHCKITSASWSGLVYYCPPTVSQDGSEHTVSSVQHIASFQDCILYELSNEWFSDSGDSGAAILTFDTSSNQYKTVGLHFAGAASTLPVKTYGLGCKISNVLSDLNCSIWNGQIKINQSTFEGLASDTHVKVDGKCYKIHSASSALDITHSPPDITPTPGTPTLTPGTPTKAQTDAEAGRKYQTYESEENCGSGILSTPTVTLSPTVSVTLSPTVSVTLSPTVTPTKTESPTPTLTP